VDEGAGEATNVIHLNLTSNTTPSPYMVFERTEDPNLYKLLSGTISGAKGVTSMVVDMGSEMKINGYRWFYDYPTGSGSTPDFWEVYTSNNLPHWDFAASQEDSTFRWGWSDNYDLPTTSGYRYYLFKFYEEVRLKQIEFIQKNVPLSTDSVVIKTTVSGEWSYSNVGRISHVNVLADEPDTTHVFHAITTDSGNSYKIWDEEAWLITVRLNGSAWQYYDTSWHNSSENSVYGAFRQSVEDASQMFSTEQLEDVQEASWGLTSISGTLGFISYLVSYGNSNPRLSGYQALYQVLPSGISSVILDGYSYSTTTTSGLYAVRGLSPEASTEQKYDKKLLQDVRVYLANTSSVSGVGITEIALLDVQTPNDPYYLAPISDPIMGSPISSEGDYAYT
jgi:hypothetical protein